MVTRKIVKHGSASLTITLPSNWVKSNKLEKGQEIGIIEKGLYLIVDSKGRQESFSKNVEFSDKISPSTIMHYTASLYRVGYDEVIFRYNNAETYEAIDKVVGSDLNGFDIIKNSGKSCTIKSMSKIDEEEFDNILTSLLHGVSEIAKSSLEAVKNKDINGIKLAQTQESIINRNANYCERKLIKEGHSSPEEIPFLFYIIKELENIGDEYDDICTHYLKSLKLNKKTLKLYAEVNDCFVLLKQLILKQLVKKSLKLDDGSKLHNDLRNKSKEIDDLLEANDEDDCVLHHLSLILRRTKSCLGCLFSIMVVDENNK